MKKDIKEYLHLYLGCEFIFSATKDFSTHELCTESLNTIYEDSDFYEIKLVLRPISDMTESEKADFYKTQQFITATPVHVVGNYHWTPETFLWLVNHGFDIFNLIDMGLAIDKTKINQL